MGDVIADYIYETKDYNKFNLYEVNRQVKEESARFKNLLETMQKYDFLSANPIHCFIENGRLTIKAGHHRFIAAMKLGLPIKYVICDSDITIYELENAGAGGWTISDYLTSFANKGIPSYVLLKEFCDDTGIAPSVALTLFSKGTKQKGVRHIGTGYKLKESFGNGEWVVEETTLPEIIGGVVKFLKGKGKKWASHQSFVTALYRMMSVEGFSLKHFEYKLKTKIELCEKQRNIYTYLEMLELIYNHGSPKNKRLNIKFLAREIFET